MLSSTQRSRKFREMLKEDNEKVETYRRKDGEKEKGLHQTEINFICKATAENQSKEKCEAESMESRKNQQKYFRKCQLKCK